ncbi:MAG: amino acid adenylation domain-containing protein [Lachnospiraceae bacterium]|nr:amino acid adenylation domain-containing protein [Lachnospiraceae bacterium]
MNKITEEFCYGGKMEWEKATCHEFFELTAEKYPDKIALRMKDECFTYSELNKKANQLARNLRKKGVGPDVCVAIMGEKELETIISILAIWKAGGAFVAIDNNLGEERVTYILKDCKSLLLLKCRKELNFSTDIPVISMLDEGYYQGEDDNPENVVDGSNLAYFVYTSGSTGTPKGVMQHHRGTVRFHNHFLINDISPNDTLLQFSSFSFAMSVWELSISFFTGATLCMIPEYYVLDTREFEKYIQKYKVNILLLPRQYIEQVKCYDGVDKIFTAGSEMTSEVFDYIPKGVQFTQMYGTSEVSGVVTQWRYSGEAVESKLPIGKPMPNCYVYIVKEGRLCSIGEIGDIYIAGECISRGYVSKPELTKEVFIPNLFGDGIMYATGDMGRWLADGNIVFHGRKDSQVKIRGYRVELGEIEAVLRSKESIQEAAVVLKEDKQKEKIICAYITADKEIDLSVLKKELRKSLPEYMIPAKIMQLKEMPLTISRKLDKNRLPDIDLAIRSNYIPPETKLQKQLASMFEKILGVENVGIKDSFFDLGGHSLSVSKLLNAININCGIYLSIKSIFEHPVISELSEEVEKCRNKVQEDMSVPKSHKKEKYAMSPVQKGIYFACQMNENTAYNIFSGYRLEGILDVRKLYDALEELTVRHEMLRTSFHIENGELVQCVHDEAIVNFEFKKDNRDIEELISEFNRIFQLEKAPLMRVCLIEQKDCHLLMMEIHHIITDKTSNAIFFNELSCIYNNTQLSQKTLDYIDYSEWINHRNLELQKKFWLEKFAEPNSVIELPLDMTRPQIQDFAGDSVSAFVSPKLRGKISGLGKITNTTDYMIFMSVFMVLLSQYSGQDDIVVGTPISGRATHDLEDMFGMFVNSMPMRGKPEKDKDFASFLKEIMNFSLMAYENQEYPFEELVRQLKVKRDISRNPLFDYMLVMQNTQEQNLEMDCLKISALKQNNFTAKFDLTIFIYNREGQYEIQLEYCSKLFKRSTAMSMLEHYIHILTYITDNQNIRIDDIPLVSKEGQELILNVFNATESDYDKRSILSLIEEQAVINPEQIALYDKDRRLTYNEMDGKANQLACYLAESGVKKGDIIAIISERSIEFVVGVLAILKAGGVFVPIDPDYPEDRILYILGDCAPALILCSESAAINWNVPTISMNVIKEYAGIEKNNQIAPLSAELVYMIYTSGTTGKPKGTMITHAGLSNYINYGIENYVSKPPVAPLFTNLCFDLTMTTLFLPLCCGGRIKIYNAPIDEMIREIFAEDEFTLIKCTPAHLKFAANCEKRLLMNLETMIIGGEELETMTSEQVLENFGHHIKIHNEYGPTEATIGCCDHIYTGNELNRTVSIGKPINNMQIYIMENERLCGIGIPGELCISGIGIAKGYWNNEEMTAAKFVSNPFGEGILYRTGDKARWLAEQTLEYLGRIDEQIKIRGFRIEPGEISNCIRKQEGIKDAVVITRESNAGEKQLYGYYTADENKENEQIKELLRKELPEYMIPIYLMQIDHIPITRNGKIDKKLLPLIKTDSAMGKAAPRNDKEKVISEIFKSVLEIENVGIYDNFFELGGHSLKAAKMIHLIEEAFRIKLMLSEIFHFPNISKLAEYLGQKNEVHGTGGIPRAETLQFYEAAPVQKGIYLIADNEKSTVYNMPYGVKLTGKLDTTRLSAVFEKIINRYEILRTGFRLHEGKIIQQISELPDFDFKVIPAEAKDYDLASMVEPFDLAKAPLLRIRVIKGEEESILFLDIHHLVCDGISLSVIINEISDLYNGAAGEEPKLQYKDYSQWMYSRDMSSQRQYWLNKFSDEIPVLDLPIDFSRPQFQSFHGSRILKTLGNELTSAIKKLAIEKGVTEYMVFLSIYMMMLSNYSRQDKVVVGCPVTGRTDKDIHNMPGMFVNSVGLIGEVNQDSGYQDFLKQIKINTLEAYSNQEYPLEVLLDDLKIKRDYSRNPLFQVMLVMQNQEQVNFKLDEIKANEINIKSFVSKFDLTLCIKEVDNTFRIEFEYCTDLFRKETIGYMLEHFICLIAGVTDNPNKILKEYSMVSAEEQKKILTKFNHTKLKYEENLYIHEIFEKVSAFSPDSIAVWHNGKNLTYRQLNEKANQLASWLMKNVVADGNHVAILADKSIETVISIIAVLKSGAAYVPIDREMPEKRRSYVLSDTSPVIILTNECFVLKGWNIQEVSLKDWKFGQEPVKNTNLPYDEERLAYILYTSGTTGNPKGVMVKHSGVVNLAHFQRKQYKITQQDRILQFANFVFDASVWECVMALLNGATLYIPNEETILEPKKLEKFAEENQITVMTIPPHYFLQMQISDIRVLITAGSAPDLSVLERVPDSTCYVNAYGPTEVTVCGTDWIWDKSEITNIIPIGRPIANTQIYILRHGNLCGIGVPGEICISGAGVTKGYLNQKKLTAEKFVKNPFGQGMMYKTGDVGRWLDNGNVEFLGRMDEQVKVRGYRIELKEIENVIRKIKGIKDAVAIVRENEACESNIYAYYTSEFPLNGNEIKKELRKSLPEYMIPSCIISVESIPVNRSGKVDKTKLPAEVIVTEQDDEQAITENQKEIGAIFEFVLGINKAGKKTDFFESGGHSLKAVKIINEIEKKYNIRLSVKDIFIYPTPESLAAYIEENAKDKYYEAIQACKEKDFYPVSHMQKGIYIICKMKDTISYNMPKAISFKGRLNLEKLRNVFSILLKRHEILRTSFHVEQNEVVQKVHRKAEVEISYAEAEEFTERMMNEFVRVFDLGKAPLVRAGIIRQKEYDVLLLDIHHIISDGLSADILTREISALYNGVILKENTIQYKDFSSWLKTRDTGAHRKFWIEEVGGEASVLNFPLDKSRPKYQTFQGDRIVMNFAEETSKLIRRMGRDYSVSDYMIFLAGYMILLSKYSRQEDVMIGSPLAGRFRKETENMLGMFVNTMPIREKIEKNQTFTDFLQKIKNKVLQVVEHEAYSFESLISQLGIKPDHSRNALFDIVLAVQNQKAAAWRLNEAETVKVWEVNTNTSKFDITLIIDSSKPKYEMELEYCTDLFYKETMERMLKHFICLMKDISLNPNKIIDEFSMVDEDEKSALLCMSQATMTGYFDSELIHERFENIAVQFPERIAIIHNERQITYRELNEKANQTAHYLRIKGVGRNSLVAVLGEKKIETMILILGILKAGGAYVPIDPEYPAERIEYILEDCQPVLFLKDVPLSEKNKTNPKHINEADDLAYIIYTSGTTGKPKGVMLEHKGLINLYYHCQIAYGLSEEEVVLQFANLTFDASVWEIAMAFLSGGTLCIVDKEIITDVRKFERYVYANGVTLLLLPPQYYLQVELSGIKRIITGGSPADKTVLDHVPDNIVYSNAYGPTEITVFCTDWEARPGEIVEKVPIGRPISNTSIYIMDNNQICGIGVPGELCVGGPGVARGYLNQSGLTKERFVTNLQGESRIYRTGDLARWTENGTIEYLGRMDNQVKIRGHRVELGEIESVIRTVAGVKDAIVIVRKSGDTDEQLYAYFTSDIVINMDEIKQVLHRKLPEYMIPKLMMKLEEIPVGQSGKPQHHKLPDIKMVSEKEYMIPNGEKEQAVANVYMQVLKLDKVGRNDSFFDLGGNSMKAIIVINHLNKKGYKISSQDIMRYPVVEKLAARLK